MRRLDCFFAAASLASGGTTRSRATTLHPYVIGRIVPDSEEINFSFVTGRFLLKKIAIESGLLIGTDYVKFKALPIVGVLVPFRWKRLIKD
jgi:hypothetical protein